MWLSVVQTPERLEAERGIFLNCVEARALLYPLPRLDDAVSVQVGAEVTMPADRAFRIDIEQHADEEAQRLALVGGAGIGGSAVRE